MSWPRRFVELDRHPPTCISHPVMLEREYGFLVVSDLRSILFWEYSVDLLSLLYMVLWLQFRYFHFQAQQQELKWSIARKPTILLTSQWVYLEPPCLSKRYSNTPVLFPSCLRLRIGAVLNPVIGLSADLFLLFVPFLTSSALRTTNTYVLLLTKT